MTQRPVLGLDLGGTQIRAAVVMPDGARLARVADETRSQDGPESVVRRCVNALRGARDEAPADVRDDLAGVGISSPGPVDPWRGVVVEPPNLGPRFRDIALAAAVEDALGLPAYLDRDTHLAALGEQAFGAARDVSDFLYITVSTGIGGAVVSNGRLLHGPDGTAGELGHVTVDYRGPRCGCGGVGHVEALASGVALAREARAAATSGASRFLADRARERGDASLEGRDVAEGEDAGDAACHEIMEQARLAFARAMVSYVDVFDPDRVIVGGSIAEHQGDRLLGPAREAVASEAFRTPAARVRIVRAELGGDVSLAGALPLVAARLGDPGWRRGRGPVAPHQGVNA